MVHFLATEGKTDIFFCKTSKESHSKIPELCLNDLGTLCCCEELDFSLLFFFESEKIKIAKHTFLLLKMVMRNKSHLHFI